MKICVCVLDLLVKRKKAFLKIAYRTRYNTALTKSEGSTVVFLIFHTTVYNYFFSQTYHVSNVMKNLKHLILPISEVGHIVIHSCSSLLSRINLPSEKVPIYKHCKFLMLVVYPPRNLSKLSRTWCGLYVHLKVKIHSEHNLQMLV